MLNAWRDLRVPLTAAGFGAAGIAAALILGGASSMAAVVAAVVTGLLAAVSLLAVSARVGTGQRHESPYMRWLAAGAVVWLLGVGLRPVAEGTAFVLTFADLLLAVGAAMLTIGCASSATWPPPGRGVLRLASDAYLSAASLFVIGWVLWLGGVYRSAEEPGMVYAEFALPLLCLLATCAAAAVVLAPDSGAHGGGRAGLVVLATITVAEFATAAARIGGEAPPLLTGLLTPLAFLLMAGVAAWTAEGRALPSWPVPHWVSAAVPLALVAVATVLLAAGMVTGGLATDAAVLPIVVASMVLVLLLRLFVLLIEGMALRHRIEAGERRLRGLAESAGHVVLVCDTEGVIHEIGDGVEDTYGYRPDQLVTNAIFDYVHPEDVPTIQNALAAFDEDVSDRQGACRIACRIRAADGTWRPTEAVATRHGGVEDHIMVSARDVSDHVALQNQVAHLTFHDGVTGLPNRAYFEERTREVLARPYTSGTAVIFVDLDGFTAVNDSVGHASGDYLLGQAARRLRGTVGGDATLARWGGDEFAVLIEGGDGQNAVDLAERLVGAVSGEPFRIADRDVALTASVGVAFDEEDMPAGDLIRNADVAMAKAKQQGGRRVEVFAAQMHADVVRRLEIAADLQRALLDKQFTVEYQPVVDLATSRVTAVEALVRWWRGGAFVPPEQFLGAAEDTGVIVPLSEWILREACREVAGWRASAWDVGLSVNLSTRQINAPRFVETVRSALEDSGLPASALTLEVIEEMLVEDAEETLARLAELRSLGVRLAIDDFGTGYASLAFLREVPVDMIKIDPSFVAGLGRDETLTLLTRTIVRLGNDLGLIVVAEGIERPEQLDLLREMGCTRGQGFLVARPTTAHGVETLMRTTLAGLQNTA
ncbi:EAL domain-containing protein [Thermopolyspora sp. NPDC052614]|uniref:putative bifunctional diguanylate cyclase/phosphodiesterase n=1 Tax=Thermopolyspora sp. NPDC052614 TaxID=3155682 RepID=UPI00341C1942